ncbi:MAG TPA: hypothetical protein ENJ31_08280, partial [Anaerolineae bacterium]|nr:hypothetical protein [Anaerolineae bacterium]
MKRMILLLFMATLIVLIAQTGIGKATQAAPMGIIYKSGTLGGDETWTSDNVYVINGDLTVPSGVTLTVESGTVIKFKTRSSATSLIVDGTLNVNGTSSNMVYFTSIRDDTVGGDTNGDGDNTSPAAGDWDRVYLRSGSSGSTISYAELRYAGGYYSGENYGAIHLEGSSPTLSHIIVRSSDWSAISALASDQPTITNFTAYNTPYGGLEIRGGTLSTNATWDQTDIVYILTNNVSVAGGTTLTIDAGMIIKFREKSNAASLTVDGTLNVNGTSSNMVYFTSIRDDTVGGDTNGNGNSTSPSAGDWDRIYLRSGSSGSTISYAELRYAGGYYSGENYGAIHLEGSSPTLSHIIVR